MTAVAMGLVCLLTLATPAMADDFTVPEGGYHSTDTLTMTDFWHEYHLSAGSDEDVKYSFEVQGSGEIMVLFAQGSTFTITSNYYSLYSKDTPVTHYSNTFPVDSSDGTAFTIVVITDDLTNVTYDVDITVEKTPATTYLFGVLILVGIVVAIVVIRVLIKRGRKPAVQFVPPQQPQQAPTAPPQQAPPQNPPAP